MDVHDPGLVTAERKPVSGRPFLHCPRCGLSLKPRASWLEVDYCPRCLGRARIAVKLFSSPLSAEELYHRHFRPSASNR